MLPTWRKYAWTSKRSIVHGTSLYCSYCSHQDLKHEYWWRFRNKALLVFKPNVFQWCQFGSAILLRSPFAFSSLSLHRCFKIRKVSWLQHQVMFFTAWWSGFSILKDNPLFISLPSSFPGFDLQPMFRLFLSLVGETFASAALRVWMHICAVVPGAVRLLCLTVFCWSRSSSLGGWDCTGPGGWFKLVSHSSGWSKTKGPRNR